MKKFSFLFVLIPIAAAVAIIFFILSTVFMWGSQPDDPEYARSHITADNNKRAASLWGDYVPVEKMVIDGRKVDSEFYDLEHETDDTSREAWIDLNASIYYKDDTQVEITVAFTDEYRDSFGEGQTGDTSSPRSVPCLTYDDGHYYRTSFSDGGVYYYVSGSDIDTVIATVSNLTA